MEKVTCKSCGKEAEIVNKVVTTDIGKALIMVKNVPSVVCEHCGNCGYFVDVHADVSRLVKLLAKKATGVVVVDYSERENFFGSELELQGNITEVVL